MKPKLESKDIMDIFQNMQFTKNDLIQKYINKSLSSEELMKLYFFVVTDVIHHDLKELIDDYVKMGSAVKELLEEKKTSIKILQEGEEVMYDALGRCHRRK
jgi:hypothetical protein